MRNGDLAMTVQSVGFAITNDTDVLLVSGNTCNVTRSSGHLSERAIESLLFKFNASISLSFYAS